MTAVLHVLLDQSFTSLLGELGAVIVPETGVSCVEKNQKLSYYCFFFFPQ